MIDSDRVSGADSLYVDAGGRRLHYLRAGEKAPVTSPDDPSAASADEPPAAEVSEPPVVLVHGSGIDDAALSWRHAIPALAGDGHRVYAPDLPGYGDSDDPEADPTAGYYANVLADFLDAIPAERPIVVGISMGGAAALGVALDSPERVRAVVPVASYGLRNAIPGGPGTYVLANAPFASMVGRTLAWGSPGGARAVVDPLVADPGGLDDDFLAEVSERLAEPGALDSFVAFQRTEFGPSGVATHYADELQSLAVPALFVHGERDGLVPIDWARAAAAAAPDAELVELSDCGHWPPRERPEAFLDAIRPFLARF